MPYFRTKLDLWLLSLKTHRHVADKPCLAKYLRQAGKAPIFVRSGAGWGWCHGMFSSLGWGLAHARRLKAIRPDLSRHSIHDAFAVEQASDVAVKVRVARRGPVDVWVIANKGGKPFVYLHRQLDFARKEAFHALMTFHPSYRGGGFAGKILQSSLQFYESYGVRKIKLVAGLSHGGAHWAKVGFLPEEGEFEGVATKVKENLAELLMRQDLPAVFLRQHGVSLEVVVNKILAARRFAWIWELRELGRGDDLLSCNGMSLGAALLRGTRWRGYLDLDDERMATRLRGYIASCKK